jgi:hypothetical protein
MDIDEESEQREQGKAALRESTERYRILTDTVPGTIWTARRQP